MCGIVAVLRRPGAWELPDLAEAISLLAEAEDQLRPSDDLAARLQAAVDSIAAANTMLMGATGVAALLAEPVRRAEIEHRATALTQAVAALEAQLDASDLGDA